MHDVLDAKMIEVLLKGNYSRDAGVHCTAAGDATASWRGAIITADALLDLIEKTKAPEPMLVGIVCRPDTVKALEQRLA